MLDYSGKALSWASFLISLLVLISYPKTLGEHKKLSGTNTLTYYATGWAA